MSLEIKQELIRTLEGKCAGGFNVKPEFFKILGLVDKEGSVCVPIKRDFYAGDERVKQERTVKINPDNCKEIQLGKNSLIYSLYTCGPVPSTFRFVDERGFEELITIEEIVNMIGIDIDETTIKQALGCVAPRESSQLKTNSTTFQQFNWENASSALKPFKRLCDDKTTCNSAQLSVILQTLELDNGKIAEIISHCKGKDITFTYQAGKPVISVPTSSKEPYYGGYPYILELSKITQEVGVNKAETEYYTDILSK